MWADSKVCEFKLAEVQPFSEEGFQCGCGRLRKRWEVRRQKRKCSQGVGWNIHVDGEVTQIMAGLRGECKSEPDSEVLSE